MVKPVMLAVDDPQLLRAVERDLRRGHRVLRADPGESVLDKLPSGDPAPLSLVTWPFYRPRRGGRVRLQAG